MPAPQASMMQQLARAKFTSFAIKVPTNWREPAGDANDQYRNAHKPEHLATAPGMPPLFQPASLNKYHTDTQKQHISAVGSFIDGICSAICSAWSQWLGLATMPGVAFAGPLANGGVLTGPPMGPMILLTAPKNTPMLTMYSAAVANAVGTSWQLFTTTVKIVALPLYPMYALVPAPAAPPAPSVPVPFASLVSVPTSMTMQPLKTMMVANLGQPRAPFHAELFESIATAVASCFTTWQGTTMVKNIVPTGPGAGPGTPIVPAPVAGVAAMLPGGLA